MRLKCLSNCLDPAVADIGRLFQSLGSTAAEERSPRLELVRTIATGGDQSANKLTVLAKLEGTHRVRTYVVYCC